MRRLILLFGLSAIGVVGLILAISAWLIFKSIPPASVLTPPAMAEDLVAKEFHQGVIEYNARNWEIAQTHFLKVITLAPAQNHVNQYIEQAKAEREASLTLEQARKLLVAGDYSGARSYLAQIRPRSVYFTETHALATKADREQTTKLLEQAQMLWEKGDAAESLVFAKEAQTISPSSKRVLALLNQISSSVGSSGKLKQRPQGKGKDNSTPSKGRPTASPKIYPPKDKDKGKDIETETETEVVSKKPGSKTGSIQGGAGKTALAHYKKKEWGPAYQVMKNYAESLKGKAQVSAQSLAEAIRMVGQSWTQAEQAKDPGQKLKQYQLALINDLKIEGGSYQKALKEKILELARIVANDALNNKKYSEAYRAVITTKGVAKNDPALQKILTALESKAQEMVSRGNEVKATNLGQARQLWQEVLRMVPPSSASYQKAYSLLNNSGANQRDEDEE